MVTELEKRTELREDRPLKLSDHQPVGVAEMLQVVAVDAAVVADAAAVVADAAAAVVAVVAADDAVVAADAVVAVAAAAAVVAVAAADAAADYQMNSGVATAAEGATDFELGTDFPLHYKEMKLRAATVVTSYKEHLEFAGTAQLMD